MNDKPIMSVDGSGKGNVFLSSPRVSFGEPLSTTNTATTSLLTFADMVLALDHKNGCEGASLESSCAYLGQKESDHTYASNGSTRTTTRSQTAKAAAALLMTMEHNVSAIVCEEMPNNLNHINQDDNVLTNAISNCWSSPLGMISEKYKKSLNHKRCSSVENLNCNLTATLKNEIDTHDCINRASEWPNTFSNNSPRKSISCEKVCFDNDKSSIKSSKSTESVQKSCFSFTLHRLVNDTLEFPCWPRKADHTYATATWDGTAASHCLIEQEMSKDNCNEDQHMEITDHDYLSQRLNVSCETSSTCQPQILQNFIHHIITQKEDHTYVKPKTTLSCCPETSDITLPVKENVERHNFSSATFPRQKTRDDHTYFHSGLSGKNSGSLGAKDWPSVQTVSSEDKYIEEAYRSLQSSTQSSYAKKDHNYSTST
ncbi:hypothetical protein Btru_067521 [Bulinus truncatus]|nr:hypothetical protein Btru_067521 [Bulinus truncatus]